MYSKFVEVALKLWIKLATWNDWKSLHFRHPVKRRAVKHLAMQATLYETLREY